jgi:hypothetical protein
VLEDMRLTATGTVSLHVARGRYPEPPADNVRSSATTRRGSPAPLAEGNAEPDHGPALTVATKPPTVFAYCLMIKPGVAPGCASSLSYARSRRLGGPRMTGRS